MQTLTSTKARSSLYSVIDQASRTHQPIQITGKRNSAVIVSLEDWNAIQETLYLLAIPKMRESIQEGLKTPVKKCSKALPW